MESNYDNKDFEQYVKQNADQFRMFPSDKVWKGINNAVHTRRKWYGLWLGFLLLVTGRRCFMGNDYIPLIKEGQFFCFK